MKSMPHLGNPVWKKAYHMAGQLLGNPHRLLTLLGQLAKKADRVEGKGKAGREVRGKVFVLARLLRAVASGRYRALPWKAAASIVSAVLYFVNPADIIPDFVPFTGLLDDFSILVWTYNAVQDELEKFLEWERHELSKP